MERTVLLWLLLIPLSVALCLIPAKRARGERGISPYCIGTSPRKQVEVEVNEKSFVPTTVRVNEGDCVELSVHARGRDAHSLMIKATDITSEGAPIINSEGRHSGRALARENPSCPTCAPLAEGWFTDGETVLLTFEVNLPGTYAVECKKGMRMTIEADSEAVVSSP